MEVVDYKGSADALLDVLGGNVLILVDVVMPTGNLVNQGRQTGICVASPERSPICLMVPTVVELGMPDLVGAAFYELVALAGVSANIIERLNALRLEIVREEGAKKMLAESGLVTTGSTPQAFHNELVFETQRWTKVVKENNIKVEQLGQQQPIGPTTSPSQ